MKIVQINSVPNGSTGKIMLTLHSELKNRNYDSYVVWGRGRNGRDNSEIYLNDKFGVYFHVLCSRLTGKTGFFSTRSTKKLIERLKEIKPDIIHLHNIHGYYINIELLFNYIKENDVRVIWTLHDCWSFTGQCPHFASENCNLWITGCHNCPLTHEYPKALVDNSKWNYQKKKELFSGVRMTIVTPSKWLAGLVKKSFLKDYPLIVINNGIELDTFRPTESNFREKHNIVNKKIILGVASVWTPKKGLDDFIELSKIIDGDYVIVLIGVNKQQIKKLPGNIIGIEKTENQEEMVEIYSTADVFFNPTYEDNYPTVNLEAIACGTPVITYDTGGSGESALLYGKVVNKEQFFKDYKEIICQKYERKNVDISKKDMVNSYIKLYEKTE